MSADPRTQIGELLRNEDRFILATHHRPDGDAIGSTLALALLLKNLGKSVLAWNDDGVPQKFKFLRGSELITPPPQTAQECDVFIAIDTSTRERLGDALGRFRAKKSVVNIDHHVSNENFGDINFVVPEAPATGVLVYEIFRAGNFEITPDIAACLFAAISTDTGSFSYSSTTADCLRVAADLVERGKLDVGELSRHIYESYPLARVQLLQMALSNLKIAANGRLAYYWVTRQMYRDTNARREDTEGVIDNVRAIEGVVVAMMIEEMDEPNSFRISLRSKNPRVDVNQIAQKFGGGGHPAASGARVSGNAADIERQLVTAITEALDRSHA
jgi:phosphoesterase RecJ-like protein